jgi:hypothetical protein
MWRTLIRGSIRALKALAVFRMAVASGFTLPFVSARDFRILFPSVNHEVRGKSGSNARRSGGGG